MAHYAYIDQNNIVTDVVVGRNEGEDGIDWELYYKAKRTSYNTRGGVHAFGGTPFRKNYAGIGFSYDPSRDAFIPPKPYSSWILNEESCLWEPPLPYPDDGKRYDWNEETTSWKEINP